MPEAAEKRGVSASAVGGGAQRVEWLKEKVFHPPCFFSLKHL